MAKRFTIEILMDLAKSIGANPNKFMGTKTNIEFLGKGPMKNPLFQNPLAGLERASPANLGKRETLIEAVEDAMGYLSSGKLNSIQSEILGHNLSGINKIYNPPPSNVTSMMDAFVRKQMGIAGLRKFPKETHKFMGRPLKSKDIGAGPRRYNELTGLNRPREVKSRLPEPGPGELASFTGALDQKTGMSRAIARNLLLKDTRLKLSPDDLFMLKEGKGEPLDLMQKYYGRSMSAYDDFLNQVNLEAARPDEFAEMILKNVRLVPQFAEGGLAEIIQAPRRGRVVHPGGYSGKRQRFIDLYRSGKGTRQKYIDLSGHGFKKKSLAVPIDLNELTIYEMLLSGALPSELKHGGLARILEV